MGRGGFGKGKYKRIIKSIYPSTPDGDVQVHNIGKLVHFCQISPTKLIKVARYVEKKTNSDLTKSRLRFVGASMKIFQDLTKGCRKNLNLFSGNILRLIKILLECSFPTLKIIATETFIQFTEVLDENTPYPELEGLVPYLIDMCQNQIRDDAIRTRLKQDGLKEMTDELDGFIARNSDTDNWAVLLPAILDNLSFVPTAAPASLSSLVVTEARGNRDAEGAEDHLKTESLESSLELTHEESIHALATEVLRDIFSRANISVTSLFKAILRYLEVKNRWVPNTFATHCIQSIYDCLKVQHRQILITLLLQHAEQPHHSTEVKGQIFLTTVQFFTESTGYFMQILDSLLKHLVSSVEFTSQDQLAIENSNAHLKFQEDMIGGIGTLCSVISQQQKHEAINALCSRLGQSKHVSSSGLSSVVVIFCRAILQVIRSLQTFPMELLIPYLHMFQELSVHINTDVRVYVQKTFQNILIPPQLLQSQSLNPTFLTANFPFEEAVPEQVANVIRGALNFQIKMRIKQADNYVAMFDTLKTMLYRSGKQDLIESFPLVFSIQKFASKWKKVPPIRAHTIHTLIAAYLYCVSALFRCPELELYVDKIVAEREKKGQLCTVVLLHKRPSPNLTISADSKYSHTLQKRIAIEYVLFDRQHIVDMLSAEGGSILCNEKRLIKALLKKYKNQTDTLKSSLLHAESVMGISPQGLGLAASASTVILPPLSPSLNLSSSSVLLPSVNLNLQQSTEQERQSTDQDNATLVVVNSVTFAPEQNSEKVRDAIIDIKSMKRALAFGYPATNLTPSTRLSYDDLVANCFSKIQSSKTNELVLWNILEWLL